MDNIIIKTPGSVILHHCGTTRETHVGESNLSLSGLTLAGSCYKAEASLLKLLVPRTEESSYVQGEVEATTPELEESDKKPQHIKKYNTAMAEPVDNYNPGSLNDIYISKRSIRKAFISKRHYLPYIASEKESNSSLGGAPGVFTLSSEQEETSSSMACCPDLLLCIKTEPVECYLSDKFAELSPRDQSPVEVKPCLTVRSGDSEVATETHELSDTSRVMRPRKAKQRKNQAKVKRHRKRFDHSKEQAERLNDGESPQIARGDDDDDDDGAASDGRVEEDKGKEGPKESKTDDKACLIFPAMKKRGVEGDMENRPYKCTHCNWAFTKSSNLVSHIRTHSGLKPHVCDLCGKAYSHQGTLQQHKRLHTGERPYHCPFCEKTYIWSSDYRKHIRTHTGEKPYICDACGKDFVRSSDLRKHERNMHANNKPFPCAKCGKTFNKPLSLLRHERTHLGKRPFVCPECGKAFAMPSRMMEHRKVHSGVRPYVCHICGKAFTKSSNLLEHQSVHSGFRPHKCDSFV
ncbi:zinc finger protein 2 isoform X2 [Alosa sapidissima]|uniref:zinc finger protein 2 isoform X2 n=1 Tax=Alosa sapidissima TaxID=34773 RepID=UPI001C08F52E|nr:zinc finger protein 2 isoform X2 [Alosa sapidissima]